MKNTRNKPTITIILIFIILVSTILSGCNSSQPEIEATPTPEPIILTDTVDLTTYNDFSIALLKQVRGGEGNYVINPIMIGIALTMFGIGAQDGTLEGIETALDMNLGDANSLTSTSSAVMQELLQMDGVWFDNSFSLYVNEGPSIREDFAVRMEDYFKLNLDFVQFDNDELETDINEWAVEATSGRIDSVFGEDAINHDYNSFLLSVSAVECIWDMAFNTANTRTLPFTTDAGDSIAVPTLRGKMEIGYYESEDVTVGFLPLAGGQTTLAILIPPGDDTLEKFLEKFTGEDLILWRTLAYDVEKWLYIPKVTFSTPRTLELSNELKAMGAVDIFDAENASLENIGRNLYLSEFYQTAQIRIEETGLVESDIMPVDITRANNNNEDFFKVQRSFVFALIDEETSGILLLGAMSNPIEQ